MTKDTAEINALKHTVWRTAISKRLERFSELLDNKNVLHQQFGENYLKQLNAKISRLFRTILVLGVIYAVLMFSLYMALDKDKTEFEIFGYGFKNIGHYKEMLLFLASCISPISAVLSAYHRYLGELRGVFLTKLFPDESIRQYYSHLYIDNFADPLIKEIREPHLQNHSITRALVLIFSIAFAVFAITLLIASFVLQVIVIYDVATNPASTNLINLFVVSFALISISLSWLIGILQLPLPEVDLSNYAKLMALRANDQKKYEETLRRISKESANKERAWSYGWSLAIFALIYSTAAIALQSITTQDLEIIIVNAIFGTVLTVILSEIIISTAKKHLHQWFFSKYPSESDHRLIAFSHVAKAISFIRLTVPALIAVIYSASMLH